MIQHNRFAMVSPLRCRYEILGGRPLVFVVLAISVVIVMMPILILRKKEISPKHD